jgi:hypothetical protein
MHSEGGPAVRFHPLVAVVICTSLFATWANADTEKTVISTDRPDFVEASTTVGAGRFQFETSLAFERNSGSGTTSKLWSAPTLLRFGVGERWELRLESGVFARERVETPLGDSTEEGLTDTAVGAKWHVRPAGTDGKIPSIGMLFHVDVDSGDSEFRGEGLRPSVRVVGEWELPHDLAFGVMSGLIYDQDDSGRFTAGILGVVLARGWTEKLRSFVEVSFPQIASDDHGGNVITYDVGAAYLLSPTWQVDAAVIVGANDDSPDTGFTVGLSALF